MGHKGRTISCTADRTAQGANREPRAPKSAGAGTPTRELVAAAEGGPPNRDPGNRAALCAGDGPEHTP